MDIHKQKLTHWVNKEFKEKVLKGKIKFIENQYKQSNFKPHGIWVSVNNSWEDWFKSEWESWNKGKVCLNVELSDDINLFIIESKKQFLKEYKDLVGNAWGDDLICNYKGLRFFHEKLKEKYDGMLLLHEPFYRHRLDLNFMYFYGWDCESICIWNLDKIKLKEVKDGN